VQYAAWAADGQGVDRHLFGLRKMIQDNEAVPEIYNDTAYSRTNHWELSTSQLSSKYLDGWGYGEGLCLGDLTLLDPVLTALLFSCVRWLRPVLLDR
jgi:hypothetical protein